MLRFLTLLNYLVLALSEIGYSTAQMTGLIQTVISYVSVWFDMNIFRLKQFYMVPTSSK